MRKKYDHQNSDTVTYTLPDGYVPEFALAPLLLDTKFGNYSARADLNGNRVTYVRRLRMHRGSYSAEAYTEYTDFRKKVAKADRAQLVLIKKEIATAASK